MTFTVPSDVKHRAQANAEVNWSAVVTKAIRERLDLFDRLEKVARRSKLTPKDVEEIAKSINRGMARRYEEKFLKGASSSSTRTGS